MQFKDLKNSRRHCSPGCEHGEEVAGPPVTSGLLEGAPLKVRSLPGYETNGRARPMKRPMAEPSAGLPVLSLAARVAAAALNYAVLALLLRRSSGTQHPEGLGVCLLHLPLLQQLVSFISHEGTGRAAARCNASDARVDLQHQHRRQQQQQSSYNLAYISFGASCCTAVLLLPVWFVLPTPALGASQIEQLYEAAYTYRVAAAAFAVAGILEAAAEILALRCLFFGG